MSPNIKNSSKHCRHWSENCIPGVWRNVFGEDFWKKFLQGYENCDPRSLRKNLLSSFCSNFPEKLSKVGQKCSGTVVKTAFCVSRETFWLTKTFLEKNFLVGPIAKHFRILSWNLPVWLSVVHSTCPEDHFLV